MRSSLKILSRRQKNVHKKLWAILVLALGAFSFLIMIPELLWLGLAFAGAGVIAGAAGLKRVPVCSGIGIVLSIIACVLCLNSMI